MPRIIPVSSSAVRAWPRRAMELPPSSNSKLTTSSSSPASATSSSSATRTHSNCSSSKVNIAFLTTFGSNQTPVVDLSRHCNATRGGCTHLAKDIRYCQKWGIKVLLSLGGDRGQQSLNSTEDAHQVADYIYQNFLGGKQSPPSSRRRSFGKAVLDSVDFSVSVRTPKDRVHWEDLAKALAGYNIARRKVYLAAALQTAVWPPGLSDRSKNFIQ